MLPELLQATGDPELRRTLKTLDHFPCQVPGEQTGPHRVRPASTLAVRSHHRVPLSTGNSAPLGKAKGQVIFVQQVLATSLVSYFGAFKKFPPG